MQSPITFSSSHLSSQLCNQFNPVSLYLGEGVFGVGMEMEDEDPTLEPCHEATTITSQHNITQPLPKSSPCPTHTVQNILSHARIFTHTHTETTPCLSLTIAFSPPLTLST